MQVIPGLFIVQMEKKGRGVFTAKSLSAGDLIEICPVVIIPPEQVQLIHKTILHDYYFLWPVPAGSACLALGYGSIYNHSSNPNARVILELSSDEMSIETVKDIEAGSEILIDYDDSDGKSSGLWFKEI